MMKRMLLVVMILLLAVSAGCMVKSDEESSQNVSEIVESSEEVSVKKDIGELLENTFIRLWESDKIYIDVKMTVQENGQSTDESDKSEKSVYQYIIAADKKQKLAMLNMEQSDDSKVHYVINGNKIYDINDDEKSYQLIDYEDTIEDFIKAYTKNMNLGISESMVLSESGTTKFDGKENIEFEKYNVSVSDNTSKITITYYFKDGQPYAEVMQSDRGKTTFMFQTVSDKISNAEIFKVSSEYSDATEY